ncbi:hypothetical protein LTR08_003398 [Meristemomyces frigidus]|nr:hypothetical protein LTR08_003398 [Meristemomyces frigidus]
MAQKSFEITEHDDAGNITATYVSSSTDSKGVSRVDVILPDKTKSPWQRMLDVFLPAGYPHSVTDDYLEYQIYDSLQAFSSSIAGLLSSRAVLSSVGVGDATASPTAALLLSILQESAGRVSTIFFAHRFGTSLEPECKMYRLLADVLNDLAFVLDCLSPAFPKPVRVIILSFSSVLRALCGVAAGSAKASLSAHFARWGNLGELNAKDSSQETVISLVGMLVGSLVVTWITTPLATWTTLLLLLSIHLETNRRAVRAVSMRTLNRQRATLVYHELRRGKVPKPQDISKQERIFEWDGVLRDPNNQVNGSCLVGASMKSFLSSLESQQRSATGAMTVDSAGLITLLKQSDDRMYLLSFDSNLHPVRFDIVIKTGATPVDVLTAWWHALALSERISALSSWSHTPEKQQDRIRMMEETAADAKELMQKYGEDMKKAGWDLGTGALETTSSIRVGVR